MAVTVKSTMTPLNGRPLVRCHWRIEVAPDHPITRYYALHRLSLPKGSAAGRWDEPGSRCRTPGLSRARKRARGECESAPRCPLTPHPSYRLSTHFDAVGAPYFFGS